MDADAQKIHQQQVDATRAKRRAELVEQAGTLYLGLAPRELFRLNFGYGDAQMLLRVFASGRYRVAYLDDGHVCIEGELAELSSGHDTGRELATVVKRLFEGTGPCELYRASFDADGSKVLRVSADGAYRIVCGVSGRVLVEGPLAELAGEARHGL
ncbi:hypothetical protein [Hydrogenophaga soli]